MDILFYSNVLLWIVVLFMLFSLFLIYRQFGSVYLSTRDAITRDGVSIGSKLPEFSAKSYFSNERIPIDSFYHKPTLIAFISPGCKPCQELIPEWNKAYMKYNEKINFVIVGLGDKTSFSKLLADKSLIGELLLDEEREILASCQVRVTPFAFVIDENGTVKGKGLCNGIEHIHGLISALEGESVLVEDTNLPERTVK
ncbi:methylamine dehydrogenase accessory protein MauD [Paenibacillus sp. cl141a]|uniref:TlpA family protein disulfide reductase n=1 Tax=Paenibacillus sp. cl141a TaxID=1761877 RepID=UPI0008C1A6D4|nr:redoxin domain-containing protein [Paenibacillus sp. cl141a]SEK33178.1 methylamine dehydrogenase accessory protein MauD [Paenibacillus sp. cl141a]